MNNKRRERERERKNRKPCTIIGKRFYPMMNNVSSSDTCTVLVIVSKYDDDYLEFGYKNERCPSNDIRNEKMC